MSDRLKKILIISGFFLVTLGIAFLLYWVFFRAKPSVTPTPITPVTYQPLPGAGTGTSTRGGAIPTGAGVLPGAAGKPTALELPPPVAAPSRTEVISRQTMSALSTDPSGTGIRTYNAQEGKFYKVANDGTMTTLSDQTFFNVSKVSWGNTTDKAVITYPDDSKIMYDFKTNKQVTLPKHWDEFKFSPNDDQVVAKSLGDNETNRFPISANPDGTNARIIEEMGENADKVQVSPSPNNQVVAFSMTGDPLGFDRQSVLLVGQNNENFKGLVVEGRGFVPSWSPSGNLLAYSVYNSSDGYRPRLWVSGASGDNVNVGRRDLSVQTWADKCAWQSETVIICAVPTYLEEGAGLQRAIANDVPDEIYKIDMNTGTKTNLGQPDGNPTISQMVLTPDKKALFYTDRTSGNLVRFEL